MKLLLCMESYQGFLPNSTHPLIIRATHFRLAPLSYPQVKIFLTTSTWDLDEQVLCTSAWSRHYDRTFVTPENGLKGFRILIYIPKFITPLKEIQMTCTFSSWQCARGGPTLANTHASDVWRPKAGHRECEITHLGLRGPDSQCFV